MRRSEFIDELRSWVGTPYAHQASVKGVGADCIGLIVGALREKGLAEKQVDRFFEHWKNYSRFPNPPALRQALRDCGCVPVSPPWARVGEVLLFNIRGNAQHMAVIADQTSEELKRWTIIHSWQTAHKVTEHRLSYWHRNIVAAYSLPVEFED